jgi:ketosteroid isomerase-like protein
MIPVGSLLVTALLVMQTPPGQAAAFGKDPLSTLVEAERAFARTSVKQGVHDSFLAFFAEDGVAFQPGPVNIRQAYSQSPAPPGAASLTLNWEPVFADISRAGDLGYTTGPWVLTDEGPQRRPSRHGFYFSIWRRQEDGSWKVEVDAGTTNPPPEAPTPSFQAASAISGEATETSRDSARQELKRLERETSRRSATDGSAAAIKGVLADEARWHWPDRYPVVGRDAIEGLLAEEAGELTWEPLRADTSASADLGYTYGPYVRSSESGHYLHVWKRLPDTGWRLVVEVLVPLPPEPEPR